MQTKINKLIKKKQIGQRGTLSNDKKNIIYRIVNINIYVLNKTKNIRQKFLTILRKFDKNLHMVEDFLITL